MKRLERLFATVLVAASIAWSEYGSAQVPSASPPAPDQCSEARAKLDAASAALSDCLASGRTCDDQFKAKSDAEEAAAPCSQEPLVAGTAASPAVTQPVATPPQQVVYLKDGSVLRGELLETKNGVITFKTASGVLEIPQSSVSRFDYGAALPASTPTPSDAIGPAAASGPASSARRGWMSRQSRTFGEVYLLSGSKSFSNDWAPLQSQSEFGVSTTFWLPRAPFGLAFDVLTFGASKGNQTMQARVWNPNCGCFQEQQVTGTASAGGTEVAVGGRYVADWGILRGAIGTGVTFVNASFTVTPDAGSGGGSDSGSGAGPWLSLDGSIVIVRHIALGISTRYSSAAMKLAGLQVNAGGGHVGFFVGGSFGRPGE